MFKHPLKRSALGLALLACSVGSAFAQTTEPEQMTGLGDWRTEAVFTIGESFGGYTPPGIPDGQGAFDHGNTVQIVANHELRSTQGYPYTLANGTTLTGEESYGGSEFILDVQDEVLYAAPWMGRAAWEAAAALEVPSINATHVAVIVGDDRGDAPLLLYVGEKQSGGFLERNGLANGRLYMWVADNGDLSPADWNGTGTSRKGTFVEVNNYDPTQADTAEDQRDLGFDELGFATQAELDAQKAAIGAFNFSRPEDVHTNPAPGKGGQVVFASTGRNTSINEGADLWGTTYLIDVKINYGRIQTGNIDATITILYDGDDAGAGQVVGPDFGIRSPDNLV